MTQHSSVRRDELRSSSFRPVPRTGVIYVTTEAARRGFVPEDPDWCNLGQGQPETGALEGAPPRRESVHLALGDQDYAPVQGLWELREAVAGLYNQLFRRGMASQYTAENVAICGGGRIGLMRVCASIGRVNLGHFLPDYTAYEELLDVFDRFRPIPISLEPERGYDFTIADLRREILGRGLGALLLSNACNPTGKLVRGDELSQWVATCRSLGCALILDEFYSHYVWEGDESIVSAAAHVEDVDRDPVVVLDGLTKNWRYPGWRVTWVVGPRRVIDACASAGSFLDGGASRPMQRAAVDLVTVEHARAETAAIRRVFGAKRDRLIARLREMGVQFDRLPEGTFYAWGDLSQLPEPFNDAREFFRHALEHKVITVPGDFFDVNPGKRRLSRPSRFRQHARFSFGPSQAVLDCAMDRLHEMLQSAPG